MGCSSGFMCGMSGPPLSCGAEVDVEDDMLLVVRG